MSPVSGLKADWSSELENQANYRCPGWALLSYICLAPWRVKNYYYFKTSMRYHPTPVRTAIIKKSTNDKRWRRCGGKWTHVNGWWNCKLTPPRWKTVWRFLLKNENRTTIWPSNSTPMYMNRKKKILVQKDTRTPMFIAALFTIAETWKQPKCPSTAEWLKKDVVHIYDGILFSYKKEQDVAIWSNMSRPGGHCA